MKIPIQERGGINLYSYVYNDPSDYIDTDGLSVVAPLPLPPIIRLPPPIVISCPACDAALLGATIGTIVSALPVYGGGTVSDFYGDEIYDHLWPKPPAEPAWEACRKIKDWCDPATGRRFCVFRCDYTEDRPSGEGVDCDKKVYYRRIPKR